MECNKDEAYRAKEIAEKKLLAKNTSEAKKFALKAQSLFPGIEGIPQLVAAIDVHTAAENKINGEIDWYGILSVQPQADDETIRKQYRRLALMLHPDKNKSLGADGAFKFVSQAWSLLSDKVKRATYDRKVRANISGALHSTPRSGNFSKARKSQKSVRTPDSTAPSSSYNTKSSTFWTSCHICKMQYEYLRVYINQNLLCPHCRESFLAIETLPPGSNGRKISTHIGTIKQPKGPNAPSFGNVSFSHSNIEWSPFCNMGSPSSIVKAASVVQQAYAKVKRERVEAQAASKREEVLKRKNSGVQGGVKTSSKRRRSADVNRVYNHLNSQEAASEVAGRCKKAVNDNALLDYRTLCLRKAKIAISRKLTEWRSGKPKPIPVLEELLRTSNGEPKENCGLKRKLQAMKTVSINVESSEFYPFDRDRGETSFRENQVWAAYDIDDGMPRYYAIIDDVISLDPFKIRITWLTSNFSSFNSLHWIVSGFSQSCGEFRLSRYEIYDSSAFFSHKVTLVKDKHQLIRIYPRKGDVWALYRNWSPLWNELTMEDVIQKYDLVEVLEDYDEKQGAIVIPLVKVAGFKTVFQQQVNSREIRRINHEEIYRFSHQIPSRLLTGKEGPNAPRGCKELDPAATPAELQFIIDDQAM